MREDLRGLYELIRDRFYLGDETFEVGENRYEPVALFGIITCILNGRELIFGEYGSGKTTSSERVSSIMKGLPLEFVQASTIHGHPEQTEEKMKATLDLGILEREGREVVRWKISVFSPVLIIDEINRLPMGKQNIILNEIDRNIWSYRGETIVFKEDKTFFATVNYHDLGTTKMIPPLLDRFDIAIETGRIHPIRKRIIRRGIRDDVLRDRRIARELIDYIRENNESRKVDEILNFIREKSEEFKDKLEDRLRQEGFNVEIPRDDELKRMNREIEKVEVSEDAELFLDYLGQEVYCQLGLKKDFSKCDGCHYANFICSDLYAISNRAEISLFKYSKALAWIEEEEVSLEHVISLLPYVIWHRSEINYKKISEIRDMEKDCCDELYAVKDMIADVKRRWEEHRDYQIEAYRCMINEDYRRLREIARNVNHPFFKSLVREI